MVCQPMMRSEPRAANSPKYQEVSTQADAHSARVIARPMLARSSRRSTHSSVSGNQPAQTVSEMPL